MNLYAWVKYVHFLLRFYGFYSTNSWNFLQFEYKLVKIIGILFFTSFEEFNWLATGLVTILSCDWSSCDSSLDSSCDTSCDNRCDNFGDWPSCVSSATLLVTVLATLLVTVSFTRLVTYVLVTVLVAVFVTILETLLVTDALMTPILPHRNSSNVCCSTSKQYNCD